jgi:hypothetical protein
MITTLSRKLSPKILKELPEEIIPKLEALTTWELSTFCKELTKSVNHLQAKGISPNIPALAILEHDEIFWTHYVEAR